MEISDISRIFKIIKIVSLPLSEKVLFKILFESVKILKIRHLRKDLGQIIKNWSKFTTTPQKNFCSENVVFRRMF